MNILFFRQSKNCNVLHHLSLMKYLRSILSTDFHVFQWFLRVFHFTVTFLVGVNGTTTSNLNHVKVHVVFLIKMETKFELKN